MEEVENRVDDGGSDNSGRGSDATLETGEPFVDVKGLVSGPNRRSIYICAEEEEIPRPRKLAECSIPKPGVESASPSVGGRHPWRTRC